MTRSQVRVLACAPMFMVVWVWRSFNKHTNRRVFMNKITELDGEGRVRALSRIMAHHVPKFGRGMASFVYCQICGRIDQINFRTMYAYLVGYYIRIGKTGEIPKPSKALVRKFYFTIYDGGHCCGRGTLSLELHKIPIGVATQLK